MTKASNHIAAQTERQAIADWLRRMARNLIKSQADCLLANAVIIEENRFVRETNGAVSLARAALGE